MEVEWDVTDTNWPTNLGKIVLLSSWAFELSHATMKNNDDDNLWIQAVAVVSCLFVIVSTLCLIFSTLPQVLIMTWHDLITTMTIIKHQGCRTIQLMIWIITTSNVEQEWSFHSDDHVQSSRSSSLYYEEHWSFYLLLQFQLKTDTGEISRKFFQCNDRIWSFNIVGCTLRNYEKIRHAEIE